MNNLTDLDDPLGTPSIDPAAVRQRAHVLRRGRSGKRFVGVAGGIAVIAFAVSLARPDTAQIEVGSGAESGEPTAATPADCVPMTTVTRSFLVMSGSTPADNDTLIVALMEVLNDEAFARELHSGLDAELAARVSSDEVAGALTVSRAPDSIAIEVEVTASSEADAQRISRDLLPTLRAIVDRTPEPREGEIVEYIPGPIIEELFPEPEVTSSSC